MVSISFDTSVLLHGRSAGIFLSLGISERLGEFLILHIFMIILSVIFQFIPFADLMCTSSILKTTRIQNHINLMLKIRMIIIIDSSNTWENYNCEKTK